jgi:hypothetical protein
LVWLCSQGLNKQKIIERAEFRKIVQSGNVLHNILQIYLNGAVCSIKEISQRYWTVPLKSGIKGTVLYKEKGNCVVTENTRHRKFVEQSTKKAENLTTILCKIRQYSQEIVVTARIKLVYIFRHSSSLSPRIPGGDMNVDLPIRKGRAIHLATPHPT